MLKNIIVSGASQGIGYQTVVELSKICDAQFFVIARSQEKLLKLKDVIENSGNSKVFILAADINIDFENICNKIILQLGNSENKYIDLLINNAGLLINKSFTVSNLNDWQDVFTTNLFAPAMIINRLIPYFNHSVRSHIVNIGSMGGIQGTEKFPGLSVYSASKGALNILTESLAVELQKYNISVNAINPGTVDTEMLNQAFPGVNASVSAQEMGKFIANFALNNAKLMNGRIIQVSLRN